MTSPTIQSQADLVYGLVSRCRVAGGDLAGETWLRLERADAEALDRLRQRLDLLAPFEDEIRKLVTVRRGR